MQKYKLLFFLVAFSLLALPSKSQNTDSPYSRYGYGVLNNQAIGAAKSMGGISYGVRGVNTNPGNPASYSSIDTLTFNFDLGASYRKSFLNENGHSQNYNNGGLEYIAMQFPIGQKMGMSFGLLPFSSVGYTFGSNTTTGELTSQKYFKGSGGFSQVYGGLAYNPIKNISIGTNIHYIFGNTTYNRTLTITSIPNNPTQTWFHKLSISTIRLDIGAQYTLPIKKDQSLTFGLVYTPPTKSSGKIERILTGVASKNDTATYKGSSAPTDLPQKFGAGFTWTKEKKLTIGADLSYESWANLRYSEYMDDGLNKSNRFNNRWKVNAGFEYVSNPQDRNFFKKLRIRGGLNYANSYINVLDNNNSTSGYKEYGATLGFGIPVRDLYSGRSSYINLGFEYKNLAPDKKHLIKEQYFGITLGLSLNEVWFMKNKFR